MMIGGYWFGTMNLATEKILQNLKGKKTGVFVDDSNLYHAYRKYGWRVDFGRFKNFLSQYCLLQFINYYIAIPDKEDAALSDTSKFLDKIKSFIVLRTKPLKYTTIGDKLLKKADVDVEIVIDVIRMIDQLDVIVILSGDSDFLELKNYVTRDKNKKILFVGYEENMAWELRQCWHLYLNRIKQEVALL